MRNATPEKKLSQDRIKTNLISRIKNHYVARTRCSRSVTSLPPSSVGKLLGRTSVTDQRFFGVAGSHAGPQIDILKSSQLHPHPFKMGLEHEIEFF
jgi:hypothetical protein